MLCGHLILHEALDHGVLQNPREYCGWILIGPPEREGPAIWSRQSENRRLQASEATGGHERPRTDLELQDWQLDLGFPEVSISTTERESMDPLRLVTLAGGNANCGVLYSWTDLIARSRLRTDQERDD
jgi:hypothetical protein